MPSASFRSSVVWLEQWGAVIYAGREKRRPLNFHGALKVQRRPPFPPPHMRGEERGGERLFCPFLDLLLLYFDEPISLWDFGTKGIRDVFGVVTEGRSPRRTHLTQFLKPECFKDTFFKKVHYVVMVRQDRPSIIWFLPVTNGTKFPRERKKFQEIGKRKHTNFSHSIK